MEPYARMPAAVACALLPEAAAASARRAAARRGGRPPRGPGALPARAPLPRATDLSAAPLRSTRRRRDRHSIRPDGAAAARA